MCRKRGGSRSWYSLLCKRTQTGLGVPKEPKMRPSRTFEADPFASEPELVVIRTFQRGVDADLAKSVLEAAGIPSMIRGDTGRRYYYGYGLALKTGIELLVRADDAEDAQKILDVDASEGGSEAE
jgi:Putative prokaryotic signal transducing protein